MVLTFITINHLAFVKWTVDCVAQEIFKLLNVNCVTYGSPSHVCPDSLLIQPNPLTTYSTAKFAAIDFSQKKFPWGCEKFNPTKTYCFSVVARLFAQLQNIFISFCQHFDCTHTLDGVGSHVLFIRSISDSDSCVIPHVQFIFNPDSFTLRAWGIFVRGSVRTHTPPFHQKSDEIMRECMRISVAIMAQIYATRSRIQQPHTDAQYTHNIRWNSVEKFS